MSKKDFSLEKAFMAVKAQRYDEAQLAYETSLEKKETVEGWTGLGITKIFQLLGNQTMEEVIYCFNKAKEVPGANVGEIELQLISYSTLVIEQGTTYCLNLIDEIVKAQKEANTALLVAGIAGGIAMSSNSSVTSSVLTGITAGAAAGVGIGKLAEISSSQQAGQITLNMINQVSSGIQGYLVETKQSDNAIKFNDRVNQLKVIIQQKSLKAEDINKWYNSNWVWVWLLLVWPVGVYGLIKRYSK